MRPANGGLRSYAARVMVNEAMRIERENYLGAKAYQRKPERRGTPMVSNQKQSKQEQVKVTFDIHQVR